VFLSGYSIYEFLIGEPYDMKVSCRVREDLIQAKVFLKKNHAGIE